MLWSANNQYEIEPYDLEAELEATIQIVKTAMFGSNRIYLEVKKKIGTISAIGSTSSIPDGYLIDLSSTKKPVLFVVENELAKHDPVKHIAVQILQFSLAFDSSKPKLKKIIESAINSEKNVQQQCLAYAQANGFVNLDYLLHSMLYDADFGALVIIDEYPDELEKVFRDKLKIPVEVVTLNRYVDSNGERLYEFELFLSGLGTPVTNASNMAAGTSTVDPSEIDTLVVPAQEDGFKDTFMSENRWYAVRINSSMIPKIKYIAAYRTAPTSSITHIAPVASIDSWQGSDKYVVNFAEQAQAIGPIDLVPQGSVKAPQNIRYTSHERLISAKTLDDAF